MRCCKIQQNFPYKKFLFVILFQLSMKCTGGVIVIIHFPPESVHLFFLNSSSHKYESISTNLGQNVYDYKISDKFDYGSNRTRTTRIICPIRKLAIYDFVYTLASTNTNQPAPNLVKLSMTIRSRVSLIMNLIVSVKREFSTFELENAISDFLHASIYKY